MKDILEQSTLRLRPGWKTALWLFVGLGVVMFIVGLASGQATRTWQAFLINTLFWGGIAQAGVMLSVIWQVTDAKWGRPYKRLAEGFSAFLPYAFIAFVLVIIGAKNVYEWVSHPMAVKAGWLNLPFFATREVVALLVLFGLSLFYVRNSVRPDLALAQKLIPGWGGSYASKLLASYGPDHDAEVKRHEGRARRLAPALGILYAGIISLVAFDFVMSLDQEWYSTLFGVFFFTGGLYSALALMLVLVAVTRKKPGLSEYMTLTRHNDLAKLTFTIAMLYTYMTFSQYLVIWYSNLPEEAPFLVIRSIERTPWFPLFWTLFGVLFLFPFLGLMPRTVCRIPALTAVFAAILFTGQWWAHYLLVVPSVQISQGAGYHFYFGPHEILLTLGFAGAFFLAFFNFMGKVPVLPISDKHLCKSWHGH